MGSSNRCRLTVAKRRLTRDDKGVLVADVHTNGGPCIMTAQSHTEFVDGFYRISQDRANKIVILTGAGGEFITDVDWSSFGNAADPGVWSHVHDEGAEVLENIANIRLPVIAAIEGRAHVHSDYALLACITTEEGVETESTLGRLSPRHQGTISHAVPPVVAPAGPPHKVAPQKWPCASMIAGS